MIAMPEINYIKHLRENEDLTITEISRKLGCNWRTAKKYADSSSQLEDGGVKKSKGMMYEEVYGEIIDCWLEEDSKLKRKQRRTAKKMFEQLRAEHQFKGSYRTVCTYVEKMKRELQLVKEKRYERLEHPEGEAQVDFGTMRVVRNGQYQDIKILYLSFPYSNVAFGYPLPGETIECFLEGLQRLFYQAEGVPTVLRIDNLSAAVASIGKGDNRTYTKSFLAFQNYYHFEIQACNPARGNEKGNVEKKVGYSRNNQFLPEPVMTDFESFAHWLEEQMKADRDRLHYEKELYMSELWLDDQKKLKALPEKEYKVTEYTESSVNKYGEIQLDGEKLYVPNIKINQVITIQKTWNSFACINKNGEIIYEGLRPYMNKSNPIPWLYIFEQWLIKPRAVSYSRHFKHLPVPLQHYFLHQKQQLTKRVKGIYELITDEYTLDEIAKLLHEESRLEREPHELRYLLEAKKIAATDPDSHTPSILYSYQTDLQSYDKLIKQEVMK